jgi:RHS repeat-associated protein
MKRARILLSLLVFLLLAALALAQSGYSLFGRVVGGGGRSTGKPYTLIGAVGQPEAGTELSGGEYRLSGGGPSAAIPSESRCKPAPAQAGITAAADLPPDPRKVASEVDQTVVTDIYSTTMFLYTGSAPIQLEITPDAIDPALVAVLRGKVLTRDNAPLAGVLITILDHPEYGCTFSRQDGMFDLVVNGGNQLTVNYEKTGYPPVQRPVTLPVRDYAWLPEVALIERDDQATTIDLTSTKPMQVARSSVVSDARGVRQATVLFPQGVEASIFNTDGTTRTVNSLNVRFSEYTVGNNGPEAMPGALPPNVAYTYAVELTADEAVAGGVKINGKDVLFSKPVFYYVENFLGFPIGMAVPTGYYDDDKGAWIPDENGRVIKIITTTNGLANLDTDGDGLVDNGQVVTPTMVLTMSAAERQTLAGLYKPNQSLWRVPLHHFSRGDYNWPWGPPLDAKKPGQPAPQSDPRPDKPNTQCGSVIECQSQILGQVLNLSGVPFDLTYRSDRVPGRKAAYSLDIPLSGATLPPSVRRIDLEIVVAGQSFKKEFGPAPHQSYRFTWNGLDAYGRPLLGQQIVTVRLGYSYGVIYRTPEQQLDAFAQFGNSMTGIRGQEVTLWQVWQGRIGAWTAQGLGLGGWNLDVHHSYDPLAKVLYLGDGSRRSAESLHFEKMTTIAGTGRPCPWPYTCCGDGGPATGASFNGDLRGITLGPDGSLYIVERGSYVIRRVWPDEKITTFAGTRRKRCAPTTDPCGDGDQATKALLNDPQNIAFGPDGSLYIADNQGHRVRRVGPDGIITTVAGTGDIGFSGDGGEATKATLFNAFDVAVGPDGSIFIADNNGEFYNTHIRRVGPDGIITTVAGGGPGSDNRPANQVHLHDIASLAVGPDGSLYFGEQKSGNIRRVGTDGIITTLMRGGCESATSACGDGGLAEDAKINVPYGLAIGPDGSLFFAESSNNRVRRVGPDGIITTVAGSGRGCPDREAPCGDGGPATRAQLFNPFGLAVAPNGDLLIADSGHRRVRRVSSALPGGGGSGEILLTAEDGSEVYVFNSAGRHLRTLHPLTGAVLYQFGYDQAGRLVRVTDGAGNVTSIEHDGSGRPSAIIGPYGQRTVLTVDDQGYLATLTNPAGETTGFQYTADGLLTRMTDARGHTSSYDYDDLGRLKQDTDPAGGFMALNRTEAGRAYDVTLTTALSRTITYTVVSDTLGGQQRRNILPTGLQTNYMVGTDGSRARSFPDGSATSLVLGPDPRWDMLAPLASTTTITTPGGLQAWLTATRTVTLTQPSNPFSLASLTEMASLNGRAYTSVYHAASRTFTETTPAGRLSTTLIDSLGRPLQVQAAGLAPVSFSYDSRGRLDSVSQGTGSERRTVSFDYDSQGYLAHLADPLSRIVSFSYDAAGRVTQQTLPDGRLIGYGYDANGNLTGLTPPGRPAHTFAYTPVDLPASYTPPDVVAGPDGTAYSYNLDRQLTQLTRPDGQTINLGYDSAGRLDSLTLARGVFTYTYHPTSGNLAAISAPGSIGLAYSYDGSLLTGQSWSGPIGGSVGYSYDNNFRLTGSSVNGGQSIAFQYDPDSLLTGAGALSLSRSAQNGLLTGSTLGSLTDAWNYNRFAEPISYSARFNSAALLDFRYEYDKLGRIVTRTETVGGVTDVYVYDYELAGWLKSVTKNGRSIAVYSYDRNGNRLTFTGPGGTVSGSYDAQDRLLQYGSAVYSYTANGELQRKTAAGQTTTYQYDELGNLMAVALPSGDQITYLVDGQNRRIGKQVNGILEQGFLYESQLRPAAELDGAGNLVSRFVYATRVNVPDYMVKNGVTYRLILDHLGSPRLVVNTATGEVVQRMDYDAFGRVLTDTNPGFQPFGFAGGLYDPDTGLVRFGARDYDAEIGRWTAKDPILFNGSQVNLYIYVGNDPVGWHDPNGKDPVNSNTPDVLKNCTVESGGFDDLCGRDNHESPKTPWYIFPRVIEKCGKVSDTWSDCRTLKGGQGAAACLKILFSVPKTSGKLKEGKIVDEAADAAERLGKQYQDRLEQIYHKADTD